MSLLPSRVDVSPSPDKPRVLDIEGEEAAAAFDALGSETARRVLAAVYREPRTPPEIRESVGTSLQNVHYHLDKLEGGRLVEPAGVGYSSKGTEMTVYAPASEAVVLFAGRDGDETRLGRLLGRLFGLALVVALSSIAFAVVHGWLTADPTSGPGAESLDAADAGQAADATATAASAIDPVTAFFLGGCAVVLAIAAWWLLRPRLRSWRSSR